MAIDYVYRSTPQLGPALVDHEASFWFSPPSTFSATISGTPYSDAVDVSYALGNPEKGTDGHVYVLVKAGAALDAGDGVAIDEDTWIATSDESSPVFEVPADIEGGSVANGEYFHARRILL